ncbi:aromatic ring-hydroxylating dioxygenase subunit alpha [Streptosporangium fragile]|uniref:Aromatic ring-hydroxylating dioxygenase subunit alpha n=1 Tax=Streptosporangium fragile TaxID=46186 RepID=A0ABN3W402_9ACTN
MLTGTAYGRAAAAYNPELTLVGPGTPAGELLRRYWQPVGLAGDATTTPRAIRILGEDLILFRTRRGVPGLVHPNCAHRGSSLYYGRVEDEGIRCCYHGWLFGTDGACLDQPCEPDGGRHRDRVRQPWYPLHEWAGLIFAYMGPPDRMPVFPRFSIFEDLAEGEKLVADDRSVGSGGPVIVDFNWLQHWENVMDPFHAPILHGSFSGVQFVKEMGVLPEVEWEVTDHGVRSIQDRRLDDGRVYRRRTQVVFPNLRVVPNPRLEVLGPADSIGWVVPIDDTTFRIYSVFRTRDPEAVARIRTLFDGRPWAELTEEEHQRMPGDYEAQKSQGDIAVHAAEHLGTTDRGVVMLRRFLKRQIDAVAAGHDPVGVAFDEEKALIQLDAAAFMTE